MELAGKIAVITGGASGIGLATAHSLAARGVKIVLADIEQDALDNTVSALSAKQVDVIGVQTDVTKKHAVEALADASWAHFGGVDILFNNAGVSLAGPTQDMTHADWQWSLDVNLWGPIHGVEAFARRMIAQDRGGQILFTASIAGLTAFPDMGPYCVAKYGVVALAECLRMDLKRFNIGVTVLCPMVVKTRIFEAERNRPRELGGPNAGHSSQSYAEQGVYGREVSVESVGELVVEGIIANAPYLHTHPESRDAIRKRFDRIAASL